jgi:predicted permease
MEEAFLSALNAQVARRGRLGVAFSWARATWDTVIHAVAMRVGHGGPGYPAGGAEQGNSGVKGPEGSLRTTLGSILQDGRFAVRGMWKSPTFTIVVVLTAALGITFSTLVFAVVNASFLRPLPHVENPEELVWLVREFPSRPGSWDLFSYADYEHFCEEATTVDEVVAVVRWVEMMVRVGDGIDRQVIGTEASENYFQALGIPMVIGRGILPEDAHSGNDVAVLGHAVWQRDFGGSNDALGQIIRIDGRAYTIVGVAPPGLNWLNFEPIEAAIWVPIRPGRRASSGTTLILVGRRHPGVTVAQAQAEFDGIVAGLATVRPEAWTDRSGAQIQVRVMTDLQSRLYAMGGPRSVASVLIYFVLVSMIMLITCSNVANMLLTRALKRRSEIAMRLALGAGRLRLVRQLLTESLILFLIAGSLGFFLIHWFTRMLAAGWGPFPAASDVTVDGWVAAFAVAIAVGSGLFFGLAPALQATRADLAAALKGTGSAVRFRRFGTRNLFVLGQVAGSMVLVAISALAVRDIQLADTLDIGFEPDDVAVVSLNLNHGDYDVEEGRRFLEELTERLGRTPGVEGVATSTWVPMSGNRWSLSVHPQGYEPGPDESPWANFNAVTPGYFELVGMPLMTGRDFAPEDDLDGPPVLIVNEAFVQRFWPGQVPMGKTLRLGDGETSFEVVGVVQDAKYTRSDFAGEGTTPHLWLPSGQQYYPFAWVHVATRGAQAPILASMRQTIRLMDEDIPVIELASMRSITDQALEEERLAAAALGGFGVVALFLAMLGIYGVLAFEVMDRTRELGVRLAVGAKPGRVVAMVVGQSLKISAVGIMIGLALSVLVSLGMRSLIIGVGVLDPYSLGGSVALLVGAAGLAGLIPAVRAASIDPVQSLRSE